MIQEPQELIWRAFRINVGAFWTDFVWILKGLGWIFGVKALSFTTSPEGENSSSEIWSCIHVIHFGAGDVTRAEMSPAPVGPSVSLVGFHGLVISLVV